MRFIVVYCEDCQAIGPLARVLKKYRPAAAIVATDDLEDIIVKINQNIVEIILIHPPWFKDSSGEVIRKIRSIEHGSSIPLYFFNKALEEKDYDALFSKLLTASNDFL